MSSVAISHNRLTAYLLLGERILATALAVLALAAGLAVNYKKPYLLMGLPIAFSIAILYVLYLNSEAIALGGYKATLEEEITRRVGYPVTFWESKVARMRHHSVPQYSMRVISCLFFGGSVVVALGRPRASRATLRLVRSSASTIWRARTWTALRASS